MDIRRTPPPAFSTAARARLAGLAIAILALAVATVAAPSADAAASTAGPATGATTAAARPDEAPVEVTLGSQDDARWITPGQSVHYTFSYYGTDFPVSIAPVGGAQTPCPGNVCSPQAPGSYVVTGRLSAGSEPRQTLLTVAAPDACTTTGAAALCTQTFGVAGEHPFVVPGGVTSVHVEAIGGTGGTQTGAINGGAGGRGGRGAVVDADLAVTPGSTFYFVVGGVGHTGQGRYIGPGDTYNGGGPGADAGASGGGATDVRTRPVSDPPTAASDPRILVAAGGGGGGGGSAGGGRADGGDAGQAGQDADAADPGGAPGTATSGGLPGGDSTCYGCGSPYLAVPAYFDDAGGGGGLHGGGGSSYGGGGGGSSLVPAGGSLALDTAASAPAVRVSYTQGPQLYDDLGGTDAVAGSPVHVRVATAPDAAPLPGYRLSVSPATGTTCTALTCTARLAGSYTITATNGTDVLTDRIRVVPAAAKRLTLTPARSVIALGASQDYRLTAVDRFGNRTAIVPTWDNPLALVSQGVRTECVVLSCTPLVRGAWQAVYRAGSLQVTATLIALPAR